MFTIGLWQLLNQKIKMDFYLFFSRSSVQFEEANEDKKFINSKRCIVEPIGGQKPECQQSFLI